VGSIRPFAQGVLERTVRGEWKFESFPIPHDPASG
jgi:hypothetical protein